ncbi:MAG: 4'-phosphopantetheinyl transferase superfamily protein [Shewanella sp.]|nr:4'-phosphopantetheinyl transferase superfamily protein [Shewanella sp.]MCF1429308.1 4'-phosphopantetheinyl transferase superfamily protein [Shewanella sp.]MCF1437756.1 4'-phosphopantetheinyl transferase superfamily protein [Shewanella sp.]MCF1456544.1 4'-phosphopantetheinyl transferase superfamily protein [Shewanella sp.]
MTLPSLHLWLIPLNPLIACVRPLPGDNELADCLSDVERVRLAGFTHAAAKRTNLLSRGMLRHVLSRHGTLSPADWKFVAGEQGKPALCESQRQAHRLAFNISHSGDWLGIGVLRGAQTGQELGIDIERFRTGVSSDSVMNRFFAPEEVEQLRQLDESKRREGFFDLWALKESFIKMTGQGLARPLGSFAFDICRLSCESGYLPLTSVNHGLQADEHRVAWNFVTLSGPQTSGFGSRFARLTGVYRVALTTCASLNAVPIQSHFW